MLSDLAQPGTSLYAQVLALVRIFAGHCHARANDESSEASIAWLLLDGWIDNPMAEAFEVDFPEYAAARVAVPDPFFEGREDSSPCLIPVPLTMQREVPDSLAEAKAQQWLTSQLTMAWLASRERLVPQPFCGLLLSRASGHAIAAHLLRLGFQMRGKEEAARLFRYHDPRVMQRVWSHLSTVQQNAWMGPIDTWWSLMHPWEPWDPDELIDGIPPVTTVPAWHKIVRPYTGGVEVAMCSGHLLDHGQWSWADASPIAGKVWQTLAADGVSVALQPDGAAMNRMLAQGIALGLAGKNLEVFVQESWRARTGSAPLNWDQPGPREDLAEVLRRLEADPQASFGSLLHELVLERNTR